MSEPKQDLNKKWQIFVAEYLVDRNATRAAVACGYKEKTAGQAGSRLLKNVKVQEELARRTAQVLGRLDVTAEKVLGGIAQIAFFDVRKFFNPDGSLKPITELDETTAFALKGLDVEKLFLHFGKGQAEEKGTITKVRFADRLAALELLGRNLKLFTDKLEISGADEIMNRLKKGRERAAKKS